MDVAAVWSVDRVGRSPQDLIGKGRGGGKPMAMLRHHGVATAAAHDAACSASKYQYTILECGRADGAEPSGRRRTRKGPISTQLISMKDPGSGTCTAYAPSAGSPHTMQPPPRHRTAPVEHEQNRSPAQRRRQQQRERARLADRDRVARRLGGGAE